MRILLISGEYPPMQGGVGDYTREMARAFAAQGHGVSVLVPVSPADAHREESVETWRVLPHVRDWRWGCWRQILSAIRDARPDVVNIQYQAAAYDMRVPAVNFLPWRVRHTPWAPPVVTTFHDLKPPYLFPKAGPLRVWVVQQLARHSGAVVVTNTEDMAVAERWFRARTEAAPFVHRIPIGSNIPVSPPPGFERDAWRARLGYVETDFVWAYFGFLNESKGGETLFRALSGAPDTHRLLMIGGRVGASDATNRAYAVRVEELMGDLEIVDRVQWTGYVPPDQVSAALLCADAVVLPYQDGISFRRGSLHAALAHGRPIISTTPAVPMRELDDGGNCLLVPPKDPQALRRAAEKLASDPALRTQVGKGAGALAQQFTWERIARRTVDEVFEPLVVAGRKR